MEYWQMFRADVNNITRKADVLGFYANGGGRKQHIIFPHKNIISYRRIIQKQTVLLEDSFIDGSNLLNCKTQLWQTMSFF